MSEESNKIVRKQLTVDDKLCECGCGQFCKIGNRYICGHNQRGKHHTEEHKKELSEMNTGENHPMYGTHPSKETRKKMSDSHIGIPNNCLGKKYSDEHRLHLSESHMGNPGYWLGKHRSEETIKKISKKSSGENNGNWKGGISSLPYCEKFDEDLKERVREYFGRECVLCGIPENGRKLCVHHVNYNKDTCCDNSKPLFVSLCRNCHSKTNGNRKYYEALFTKLIMEEYNGECYLPKNG